MVCTPLRCERNDCDDDDDDNGCDGIHDGAVDVQQHRIDDCNMSKTCVKRHENKTYIILLLSFDNDTSTWHTQQKTYV